MRHTILPIVYHVKVPKGFSSHGWQQYLQCHHKYLLKVTARLLFLWGPQIFVKNTIIYCANFGTAHYVFSWKRCWLRMKHAMSDWNGLERSEWPGILKKPASSTATHALFHFHFHLTPSQEHQWLSPKLPQRKAFPCPCNGTHGHHPESLTSCLQSHVAFLRILISQKLLFPFLESTSAQTFGYSIPEMQ